MKHCNEPEKNGNWTNASRLRCFSIFCWVDSLELKFDAIFNPNCNCYTFKPTQNSHKAKYLLFFLLDKSKLAVCSTLIHLVVNPLFLVAFAKKYMIIIKEINKRKKVRLRKRRRRRRRSNSHDIIINL